MRYQLVHTGKCLVIGLSGIAIMFVESSHDDDKHGFVDIIENDKRIIETEGQVRDLTVVLRRVREIFDIAYHIVSGISDSAAVEWGKFFKLRRFEGSD